MTRLVGILVLMSLLMVQGCESSGASRDFDQRIQSRRLSHEARAAARSRLVAMCAGPTTSCADRVVRVSNSGRLDEWSLDDWDVMRLPAYRTIIAVHEEELRKRQVPRVYEVYILGVSYYLADNADRGDITASQLVRAFNAAWLETVNRTRADVAFNASAVEAAERVNADTWAKFRDTASAIGSALNIVLGGGAAAGATRHRPWCKQAVA